MARPDDTRFTIDYTLTECIKLTDACLALTGLLSEDKGIADTMLPAVTSYLDAELLVLRTSLVALQGDFNSKRGGRS